MKILIACGGTGGHIFPGLGLYNALKKRQSNTDIILVLAKREILSPIVNEGYPHIYLSLAPLRFIPPCRCHWQGGLQNSILVLKLLKGTAQSLGVLLKFRPNVVVGFGGYASFPLLFFAWLFRIETVIYEPNVTPGLANRMLAYLVDKIAVGFAKTRDCFGVNSRKVKFTGNPLKPGLVRIEKTPAREFLGLNPDRPSPSFKNRLEEEGWGRFTILVMGGSQGAHKINTVFLKAVSLLYRSLNKSGLQIIHLCGRQDRSFLEKGYKDLGIKARVFAFFSAMEYAYSAADMVISRAGAASISEIAFFGLPSILIPYPYGHRHQLENAHYLCKNNAAILLEEEELNPEILKNKILELFNNPGLRESIGKNALGIFKPAAEQALADLVLSI
jgi:UDP-N-acetylglucosamine--N-acetylmuramyl-(pentapeptide) pyrophosphoryl-undecaprenol N-acetylglucosamine transferase